LTTEGVVSWEFAPTFDAAHRAALESGKPLIYVCPPAAWALAPLLDQLPGGPGTGPDILVLAPTPADTLDLSSSLGGIAPLGPLVACSGAARAERLLRDHAVRTLVATPSDALQLASRASLKLAGVRHLVLAWPEAVLAVDGGAALETLLADARDAQRLIATADERDPVLGDLLTRHAHRAPIAVAARLPEVASGTARYVVVDDERRPWVARALLDAANPDRALLWDPLPSRAGRWAELARDPHVRVVTEPGVERVALAIATDLVSAEVFAALGAIAEDVLVLTRSSQLPYLQRLAHAVRPVRVLSETDRASDRAADARRRLRDRLADGGLDGELLTLSPLFDEYDPALVAAAALALVRMEPTPTAEATGWTRVFITAGRRDGIRTGDVVGALVNGVGIPKDRVGRIEIRDAFSLVEVRADEADRAVRGLSGTTLRGRRVSARPDRR
jgi:ATP-dependent RNA helicase DeaD